MFPQIALTPSLSLSTYFLIISLACVISSLWFIKRAEKRELARVTAIDLVLVVLMSGFIGARLLHVFFEDPAFYRFSPVAVLQVWNGGFVYLGGVVAAFFAAVIFCRLKREPFWVWADVAVLPVALGYALGRVACLFNGCCYGKVCELPWALSLNGEHRHPTQLYASLWEMGLLLALRALEKRVKTSGVVFNVWLVGHGLGRIVMEVFRDDPRGELVLGLSLGIWMALSLAAFGAYNLLSTQRH